MEIGAYQELELVRESSNGFYLSDGQSEILLPGKQLPKYAREGDMLRVFVYTDSMDRPIATTQKPLAVVGDFAKLKVVSVTPIGAFLDWGLEKDLFCPLKEQQPRLKEGDSVIVRVYLDEVTQRVTCSNRLNRFLRQTGDHLNVGQAVKIMIIGWNRDLVNVIVDGDTRGTIFADEWFEEFKIGEYRNAYIKSIRREDGKVAISLRPQGYEAVISESDKVVRALNANGGYLHLNDKSPPEEIHKKFGLSKGAFKKIIGGLYKEGKIDIETRGIRLRDYRDY